MPHTDLLESETPERRRPSPLAWVVFSVLYVAQVALTLFVGVALGLAGMMYNRCDAAQGRDTCNYTAASIVDTVGPVWFSVVAIAVPVGAFLVSRRGRSVWWLPLAGMILVVAALVAGYAVIDAATSSAGSVRA